MFAPMPSGLLKIVARLKEVRDDTSDLQVLGFARDQLWQLQRDGVTNTKKLASIFVFTPGVPAEVHRLADMKRRAWMLAVIQNSGLELHNRGIWIVRPRLK